MYVPSVFSLNSNDSYFAYDEPRPHTDPCAPGIENFTGHHKLADLQKRSVILQGGSYGDFNYLPITLNLKQLAIDLAHKLTSDVHKPEVYAVKSTGAQAVGGPVSLYSDLLVSGPAEVSPYYQAADYEQQILQTTLSLVTREVRKHNPTLPCHPPLLKRIYQLHYHPMTEAGLCYRLGPDVTIWFPHGSSLFDGWHVSLITGYGWCVKNGELLRSHEAITNSLNAIDRREFTASQSPSMYIDLLEAMSHGATIESSDWAAARRQFSEDPHLELAWIDMQRRHRQRTGAKWIDFLNLLQLMAPHSTLCARAGDLWMHTHEYLEFPDGLAFAEAIHAHPEITPLIIDWLRGVVLVTLALAPAKQNKLQAFSLPFMRDQYQPVPYAGFRFGEETRHLALNLPFRRVTPVDIATRYFLALEQLPLLLKRHGLSTHILQPILAALELEPLADQSIPPIQNMQTLITAWSNESLQTILRHNYRLDGEVPHALLALQKKHICKKPQRKPPPQALIAAAPLLDMDALSDISDEQASALSATHSNYMIDCVQQAVSTSEQQKLLSDLSSYIKEHWTPVVTHYAEQGHAQFFIDTQLLCQTMIYLPIVFHHLNVAFQREGITGLERFKVKDLAALLAKHQLGNTPSYLAIDPVQRNAVLMAALISFTYCPSPQVDLKQTVTAFAPLICQLFALEQQVLQKQMAKYIQEPNEPRFVLVSNGLKICRTSVESARYCWQKFANNIALTAEHGISIDILVKCMLRNASITRMHNTQSKDATR